MDFDDEIMIMNEGDDNFEMNNDDNDLEEEDELPPPAPMSPDSFHSNSHHSNNSHGYHHNRHREANDVTFDTLDDFGEDTLHALMDNELRLGTVPPFSSRIVVGGDNGDDNGQLLNENDGDGDADGDGFQCGKSLVGENRANQISMDISNGLSNDTMKEHSFMNSDNERNEDPNKDMEDSFDDDSDEFDDHTTSASLLRGPLMAARSFASMNHSTGTRAATGTTAIAGVTTPSTARAQFVTSAVKDLGGRRVMDSTLSREVQPSELQYQTKQQSVQQQSVQQQSESNASHISLQKSDSPPHHEQYSNETPSTARSKETPIMSTMMKQRQTPSNLIISTQKPPRSHSRTNNNDSDANGTIHANNGAITPSAVRTQFLTSPQDSISTIGSIQSGGVVQHHVQHRRVIDEEKEGMTPSHVRCGFVSPMGGGGREVFTFTEVGHDSGGNVNNAAGDGCKDDAENNTPMNHSTNSNTNTNLSIHSQRNNSGIKGTAKPTPQSTESIRHLLTLGEEQMKQNQQQLGEEQMQQQQQQQSSTNTTSKPGNTVKKSFLKKGTRKEPSSLHKTLKTSPKTTTTTSTTKTTPHNESASERKARLAKLEKMQEDLRKDYERRERRKEEAKRERRKMMRDGKRGVVSASTVRSLGVSGNENATPSTARAMSAVKSRKEEGITPSAARAQSVVKVRVENDITPSAARAQTAAKSNNANSDKHLNPTPSQVRLHSPTGVEDDKADADMQLDSIDDASLSKDEPAVKVASIKPKQAPKSIQDKKKTPVSRRPRSLSRPKTTQSKPTAGSLSPKRSTKDAISDEKAFEDWKKKETEEWALIKNMRRRQEAALREAEGERERVSLLNISLYHYGKQSDHFIFYSSFHNTKG